MPAWSTARQSTVITSTAFLAGHVDDIRGCAVEIGDDPYTRRFGFTGITESPVLNTESPGRDSNPSGDLSSPDRPLASIVSPVAQR
jgi:hypothetical protein